MIEEPTKKERVKDEQTNVSSKVYLMVITLATVLLLLIIEMILIIPISEYTYFTVIISSGALGIAYFIIMGISILSLIVAYSLAFIVPLIISSRELKQNPKQRLSFLNDERLKPTTKKGKIKKIISDSLLLIGISLVIASQILLYGFIYL